MELFEKSEPEIMDWFWFCYEIDDCDKCPELVSKHCKTDGLGNGKETKAMSFFKMLKHEMFEGIRVRICDFILWDCDLCPAFISSRCQEKCNDKDAEEGDENNDNF